MATSILGLDSPELNEWMDELMNGYIDRRIQSCESLRTYEIQESRYIVQLTVSNE